MEKLKIVLKPGRISNAPCTPPTFFGRVGQHDLRRLGPLPLGRTRVLLGVAAATLARLVAAGGAV